MSIKMPNYNKLEVNSLIQDYPKVVYDSLLGIAAFNKQLVVLQDHCIILRRDYKQMKGTVKIIGGGGAGSEPAEAYYVGKGMLTAAVVGKLYTSPSVFEILAAIRELSVDNPDGVLLLVKNYLTLKISFGLALEKALSEDLTVKMLLIGDGVGDPAISKNERKGFAGAALVYKIVGEMAEQGKALEEIITECRENIIPDLATISLTYSPWNNLISDPLGRFIGPNEMVLGIGIYGKGGTKKIERTDLKSTVSLMLKQIFLSFQVKPESFAYDVVVLVNNLGAISKFEEAIIGKEVTQQLQDFNVNVAELLVGNFMSSKSPEGFSISILKITSPDTLKYLRAPTSAPGWPRAKYEDVDDLSTNSQTLIPTFDHDQLNRAKFENIIFGPHFSKKASSSLKQILVFAAEALASCEKQLNVFDAETGDGDLGTSLREIAEAFRKVVLANEADLCAPAKLMWLISDICCQCASSLSGVTMLVFYEAAFKVLQNAEEFTAMLCVVAFKAGVKAISHYTQVELGERTVLDALTSVSDCFEASVIRGKHFAEAVYLAVQTCEFKSEESRTVKSPTYKLMGIDEPLIYPDAGCHSLTISLRAIYEGLKVAFDEETCPLKPGIFLWVYLAKEESKYILRNDIGSEEILLFIERKLGTNENLLSTLLLESVKYCRKHHLDAKRTSAIVGTFYYTHRYFAATRWRTPQEVYLFFRESILCQCVECPPRCTEVFEPGEAKDILMFFFETYLRNLPLISIMHVHHYKLRLKIKESKFSNVKNDTENE